MSAIHGLLGPHPTCAAWAAPRLLHRVPPLHRSHAGVTHSNSRSRARRQEHAVVQAADQGFRVLHNSEPNSYPLPSPPVAAPACAVSEGAAAAAAAPTAAAAGSSLAGRAQLRPCAEPAACCSTHDPAPACASAAGAAAPPLPSAPAAAAPPAPPPAAASAALRLPSTRNLLRSRGGRPKGPSSRSSQASSRNSKSLEGGQEAGKARRRGISIMGGY